MFNKLQLSMLPAVIGFMVMFLQPVIAGKVIMYEDTVMGDEHFAGISSVQAPCKLKGKYGYIDKTGKMVINAQYQMGSDFNNGYARVDKDGKSAFIDKTGKLVTSFYSSDKELKNNDIYKLYNDYKQEDYNCIDAAVINNKYSSYVIDSKALTLNKMHGASCCFWDGRAEISFYTTSGNRREYKIGFIDTAGNIVIKPQFHSVMNFSEGLSAVSLPEDPNKYGYIDLSGNMVIAPKYDNANPFKDGVAVVSAFNINGPSYLSSDSYLKGLIDKKGNYIIQPQYTEFEGFSEGLAVVKKDGKYGYIDKAGKTVIEFKFLDAGSFSDGLAPVMVEN